MADTLMGYIKNTYNNLPKSLGNALKTSLFMEAMANINWSRDYLWYCELDGVPAPFHRGGVLGLPCTDISFTIGYGETFTIDSFMQDMFIPKRVGQINQMQLTLLDDEQGTLLEFFERWYNEIYNPYLGVLPVTEACKQITIYRQKTTRTNVKRIYYNIDKSLCKLTAPVATPLLDSLTGLFSGWKRYLSKSSTEGYDYLVFPSNQFMLNLQSESSGIIKFTVQLEIAQFVNQDFGDPKAHEGSASIGGLINTKMTNGNTLLDKIMDYI